jgi:hypothetical protein
MQVPRWKYRASIYTERDHCTLYRDDALGIQMQVMERRNWVFRRPKERVYYFVDGETRTFQSEQELFRTLRLRRAAGRHTLHAHAGKGFQNISWNWVSNEAGA